MEFNSAKTSNFLIIANGQFLPKEMIVAAAKGKTIIALDGAAEKLRQLEITPHIILGDFDSLTEEQLNDWKKNQDILIVPAHDQNYTDLEKAIQYCDQQHANSITIVCATAGRLDHHEYTMHLLEKYYRKDRLMLLHTEQQTLRYARDEQIIVTGKPGDAIGINAKHTGRVNSQGLKYECHDAETSFCNSLKDNTATLTITGGALLFLSLEI